jgi:hypothetical protein
MWNGRPLGGFFIRMESHPEVDDEITIVIASFVCVQFHVTSDQARKLSRALAAAAENAETFVAQAGA